MPHLPMSMRETAQRDGTAEMSKYLTLEQVVDKTVTVEQRHLDSADVHVDVALRAKLINPNDVILPNSLLTEIARLMALNLIYIEKQASVNNTNDQFLYFEKAKLSNAELLKPLLDSLSCASLGIAKTNIICELV